MAGKRMFGGGDLVTTFTGQAGVVIPEAAMSAVRKRCREGKRPGRYFAPGCCEHPDYVLQIPVLFEDGTYDIMRTMNIKKLADLAEEKRALLAGLVQAYSGETKTGFGNKS
jgi:hypothetical protein